MTSAIVTWLAGALILLGALVACVLFGPPWIRLGASGFLLLLAVVIVGVVIAERYS